MAERRRSLPVSVVIPVRNAWELTRGCLESLAANTPARAAEIIVVDNGSTDDTATGCAPLGERLFPGRFTCIRSELNLNFGPACNLGGRAARGDLLFFLNNDTLAHPGWPGPLLAAFRDDPRLGAAAPLLTYPPSRPGSERVQHAGLAFTPQLGPVHLYEQFPPGHPAVAKARRLQALSAAALMIPRKVFERLGGFFPGYVNGFEDVDLCCLLRRAGLRMRTVPASRLDHIASQTVGRFDAEDANRQLLAERCGTCFTPDLHRILAADGFELRFSPWLAAHAALPDAEEARLNEMYAHADDPDTLAGLLEQHPLWFGGYERLGEALEKANRWPEAAEARRLHAHFHPGLERLRALKAAAEKAGDTAQAAACDAAEDRIRAALADTEHLRRTAAHLRDRATRAGDDGLKAACDHWFSVSGPPA